ncbi:unnamed protein product, partial [Symbiodinium sp. CCMP2456]
PDANEDTEMLITHAQWADKVVTEMAPHLPKILPWFLLALLLLWHTCGNKKRKTRKLAAKSPDSSPPESCDEPPLPPPASPPGELKEDRQSAPAKKTDADTGSKEVKTAEPVKELPGDDKVVSTPVEAPGPPDKDDNRSKENKEAAQPRTDAAPAVSAFKEFHGELKSGLEIFFGPLRDKLLPKNGVDEELIES